MSPLDPHQAGLGRTQGAGQAAGQTPASKASDPQSGAAFKALLERLEEETRRLAAASEGVSNARDLSGAVGRAGESIQHAVQLGDELLEAYRAALQHEEDGGAQGA